MPRASSPFPIFYKPVSQYPPEYSDTYVKATSAYYKAYFATNPLLSLTGPIENNGWGSENYEQVENRFHIDLGSAKIIMTIYYENGHNSGALSEMGVYSFTFWGSNSATAFADLVYTHDTDWTQLTTSKATFDYHVALDIADPKYIIVTNNVAYRYYAFKFQDNWGANRMAVRRIELQSIA